MDLFGFIFAGVLAITGLVFELLVRRARRRKSDIRTLNSWRLVRTASAAFCVMVLAITFLKPSEFNLFLIMAAVLLGVAILHGHGNRPK